MTRTHLTKDYAIIVSSVALVTLLLFMIDKDSTSLFDLLKPGNLMAFFLYCIPTIIVSILVYKLFLKKFPKRKSIVFSLLTAVPICLTLIMSLFYLKLHS
jgi:uncharacterized membrane protein